jgi:hypothetical protein
MTPTDHWLRSVGNGRRSAGTGTELRPGTERLRIMSGEASYECVAYRKCRQPPNNGLELTTAR